MKIGVVLAIVLVLFIGTFVTLVVTGEKRHDAQSATCTEKGGQYIRARDMVPICIKKDAIVEMDNG